MKCQRWMTASYTRPNNNYSCPWFIQVERYTMRDRNEIKIQKRKMTKSTTNKRKKFYISTSTYNNDNCSPVNLNLFFFCSVHSQNSFLSFFYFLFSYQNRIKIFIRYCLQFLFRRVAARNRFAFVKKI